MRVIHWSDDTVEHLAEHNITPDEFEEALEYPLQRSRSRRSGLPTVVAFVRGRLIRCIYRELNPVDIEPVTAYEIEESTFS